MPRATMNRPLKALTLALSGLICVSVALAQSGSVADTIKERQKELKATGAALKTVRDGLGAGNLDPEKAKEAATQFQSAAAGIPKWFPAGSGSESGAKTAAKPEIWSDSQGFSHANDQFADQAQKFAALAAAGTVNADALKALGQTCAGCHDKYRVKQE